jgi:glycosyltransferase involved in cell wall biosynthesis
LSGVSVIVRTLDCEADLRAQVVALRRQSVPVELVVVDSGSRDGTAEVAREQADVLVELEPGTYRPGLALNRGAAVASGELHVALSSHCRLPDDAWIARAEAHFADPAIAAAHGTRTAPGGGPLTDLLVQGPDLTRSHPRWGFSNHASVWRAAVWRQHRFDEEMVGVEDRRWSWDIIDRGWRIMFDPELSVDVSHRWKGGTLAYFRRIRMEDRALASFADLPPYPLSQMVADWWQTPQDHHGWLFHHLNPRRAAGFAGRYAGLRKRG